MIYLDNSATTKPYPEALKTYQEVSEKIWGNPSSLHNLGSQAGRILEASRRQIAELLGKEPSEIFFTSGGTESNNWVIKGVAYEKRPFGNHILVSAIEHPSVKETALWLQKEGFDVDLIPVDSEGSVQLDALKNLIRPETILVSVMAVNNEIGRIQPISEISAFLETYPTISFHVDAVQALGKLPISQFLTPRVDFASFSGHKFHGVRGVGILYKKQGKPITPLLHGGGQEKDLRSTTENVAGIAATAKALRLTLEHSEQLIKKQSHMRQLIHDALMTYPDVTVFSSQDQSAPHILTFGVTGIRGEVLVHAFEAHEVYLSTTSACSSKAGHAAGTLIAMGVSTHKAQTAVRLSLGTDTDMSHIEQFLTLFNKIYHQTDKVRK